MSRGSLRQSRLLLARRRTHGAKCHPSHRCDLPDNLRRRGCRPEFMEHSDVKVEVDATLSSTQVSPQEISITLRPEVSFIVAVKQLERYPVDLYYLVDVSASMQENLDHLKTVGIALSRRMAQHTSDLWLGFGSFVDKPVSPYISVHPSKIDNPCSDYQIHCRPAHGFHHVLSMTGNISEFTRVMKRQRISGNVDTPEGGLDAMLQAAVCQVNTTLSDPSDTESGICAGTLGSTLTQHCVLLLESRSSNDTTARVWQTQSMQLTKGLHGGFESQQVSRENSRQVFNRLGGGHVQK
ncbi:hypothetical protein GOODEAATRI_005565 [Goodea atripinnis]|uniref:Integrin beta n=1 Tax=Goodea atripinnis TaxID=208336 RepID=A0ABV0N970_9TELE